MHAARESSLHADESRIDPELGKKLATYRSAIRSGSGAHRVVQATTIENVFAVLKR